jgi:hypothetical protein
MDSFRARLRTQSDVTRAAVVNGTYVVLAGLYLPVSDALVSLELWDFAFVVAFVLALGLVTAWRTWVHATRWKTTGHASWAGVWEAGLCGFAVALVVLRHGLLTRPAEAPPYILVYGTMAIAVGVLVGVVLRFVTIDVLLNPRVQAGQNFRNNP